ncbi:hypothetical protein AAU01_39240 [Paenarthrobacter aurescens]|uniref:Uncharacterized protein n=1 Tax=Paenarthrobacter aurescens TaxID=43663 RepID=A0A4Y3NR00_PAEAU|nr:hypothetical protein AAU01_39240 [Paenarthrobacter aurescens]
MAFPGDAAVPCKDAEDVGDGLGIGSVVRGTSCGVQPTNVMAAAAAVMLPMMKATRLVKVLCDISPDR